MNLTRTTVVAGIAALSLAASASPALAKGGDAAGDIDNTVISISPSAPAPFTGSGGGGGGKPSKCTSVIDPVTGVGIGTCTTNRV
jgi:hypothetical protein